MQIHMMELVIYTARTLSSIPQESKIQIHMICVQILMLL